MSEKIRQFFREIFCNPINILSLLGLAFCAYQAYFAKTSPSMYEMIMVGIVVAWALLFLIRNFFKLVFILLAVAGLAYGWYYYTNRDKAACEEKGGFWNTNTMSCEEKVPFLQRLEKMFIKTEK